MTKEKFSNPEPHEQKEFIEYNAKEGVEVALDLIMKTLKKQDLIVISIIGTGSNVGKTYIYGKIAEQLYEQNIDIGTAGDMSMMTSPILFRDTNGKKALILSSELWPMTGKEDENKAFAKQAKKINFPADKIDIRIAVYRPDKPLDNLELNTIDAIDVVIKNKEAVNKPGTI